MNLTLHHFKKEALYLFPRWIPWFALVIIELAVHHEWIKPIVLFYGPTDEPWIEWMLCAVWGGAILLVVGSCPEDKPTKNGRFIGTRPLPASNYWGARVLVLVTMIILPLSLAEGVHLMLSHLPFTDVLLGMAERAMLAVGLLGVVLPMSLLWKGWEWLIPLATLEFMATIVEKISGFFNLPPSPRFGYDTWMFDQIVGAQLFMVAVAFVLAHRHQTRPMHLAWRTLCMALLWCVCYQWWPLPSRISLGEDRPRVARMATSLHLEMLSHSLMVFAKANKVYELRTSYRAEGLERGVSVQLRPKSSAVHQRGHLIPSQVPAAAHETRGFPSYRADDSRMMLFTPYSGFKDLLPPGTLLYDAKNGGWGNDEQETLLAEFSPPVADLEHPLQVATHFDMVWWQRECAVLSLKEGAHDESGDLHVNINGVHLNKNATEQATPGAVCLTMRLEERALHDRNVGYLYILYSPKRHLAWITEDTEWGTGARGVTYGCVRHIHNASWNNVLRYEDGEETKEDPRDLKLYVMRLHLLGTTPWTWQSPELRLQDYRSDSGSSPWEREKAFYRGREIEAFKERMATLTPPTADTPTNNVRLYVHDVCAIASYTRIDQQPNGNAMLKEALRPVAEHHLEQLLGLPSDTIPGGSRSPVRKLIMDHITDAHRDFVIDHVIDHSWLLDVLKKRGWLEQAKRLKSQLLAAPSSKNSTVEVMLALNDAELRLRLIEHLRWRPRYDLFNTLWAYPELRAELASLSQELLLKGHLAFFDPMQAQDPLLIAASLGNAEAFNILIHIAAMNKEPNVVYLDLRELLGLSPHDNESWPKLEKETRHLSAADFQYVAETRTWRKKP